MMTSANKINIPWKPLDGHPIYDPKAVAERQSKIAHGLPPLVTMKVLNVLAFTSTRLQGLEGLLANWLRLSLPEQSLTQADSLSVSNPRPSLLPVGLSDMMPF